MSMWCGPDFFVGVFYEYHFLQIIYFCRLPAEGRLFRIVSRFCDLKAALNFDQNE